VRCGVTQPRKAIATVATGDTLSLELIATLAAAVVVTFAPHAAAAVGGAERAQRRVAAFAIFVALVANAPAFVATVGRGGAFQLLTAHAQAAIGQLVAGKVHAAVVFVETLDTAMALRIAPPQPGARAVGILDAFVAFTSRAMQTGWARRSEATRAAASRAGSGRRSTGSCWPAGDAHASRAAASYFCATAPHTTARRAAFGRPDVELEAIVARRGQLHEPQPGRQQPPRGVTATLPSQGVSASLRASSSAKPCG
jgi:hypothetical protein